MSVGTSRMTSKGQLTIPLEIRKKKGLTTGTGVIVRDTAEGVLIQKEIDFQKFFAPFREMAKQSKLTRKKLKNQLIDVRKETLKRLLSQKAVNASRDR